MAKTCRIAQLPWAVRDYAYALLRDESLSLNAVATLLRERHPSAVPSRKTLRNARIQCRAQVERDAREHQRVAEVTAAVIAVVEVVALALRAQMADADASAKARH
jgi:hypothetical protein